MVGEVYEDTCVVKLHLAKLHGPAIPAEGHDVTFVAVDPIPVLVRRKWHQSIIGPQKEVGRYGQAWYAPGVRTKLKSVVVGSELNVLNEDREMLNATE